MSKEVVVSPQAYIRSGIAQELIKDTLKDGSEEFTLALVSVVNSNPVLQGAEPVSIIKAGFEASALGLPISNSLGLAYIIPYNNKKKDENGKTYFQIEAQFQIGAKGFKQLAIKTGQYRRINETDVREGEYAGEDRMTGEHKFNWIDDEKERAKAPIVGYLSYIELVTGYSKSLYMTVDELKKHAKRYSKSYAKGFGNWVDDFDGMARKTVIKLLLSRHGLISGKSSKLAKAIEADQSAFNNDDTYNYIDNEKEEKAVEGEVVNE